jgi:hypothetical protein
LRSRAALFGAADGTNITSATMIGARARVGIVFSDYEAPSHFSYHRAHTNEWRQRQ